jgi:hypothetical protein
MMDMSQMFTQNSNLSLPVGIDLSGVRRLVDANKISRGQYNFCIQQNFETVEATDLYDRSRLFFFVPSECASKLEELK